MQSFSVSVQIRDKTSVGATLVVALVGERRCWQPGDHKGRPYGGIFSIPNLKIIFEIASLQLGGGVVLCKMLNVY